MERVLETVVERAQSLVDARAVIVLLEDRGVLVVAATAGEFAIERRGVRLVADGSAWRHVMIDGAIERTSKIGPRLEAALDELGIEASAALLVPLAFRDRSVGVLAAFDRAGSDPAFGPEDESLMTGFAASAAMAVTTAQSMAETRLRESIDVAERERARSRARSRRSATRSRISDRSSRSFAPRRSTSLDWGLRSRDSYRITLRRRGSRWTWRWDWPVRTGLPAPCDSIETSSRASTDSFKRSSRTSLSTPGPRA